MSALLTPQLPLILLLPTWRGLSRPSLAFAGLCISFLALLLYSSRGDNNAGPRLASPSKQVHQGDPLRPTVHLAPALSHAALNLTLAPFLGPSLARPKSSVLAQMMRLTQAATQSILHGAPGSNRAQPFSLSSRSKHPGGGGGRAGSQGQKTGAAEVAGQRGAEQEEASHDAASTGSPAATGRDKAGLSAVSKHSSGTLQDTGARSSAPGGWLGASGVPWAAPRSPQNRPHATPPHPAYKVPITVLPANEGPYSDGVCLDGSPPAYHLSPGWGPGASKWVVFLQGGAWCTSLGDCRKRAGTELGSSRRMKGTLSFRGILANTSRANPYFFDWNMVYVKYCDGASFSGTAGAAPGGLQFRGHRAFLRVVHHLMVHRGLTRASHVLLGGHSAGAIAALLHCDLFRSLLAGASPSAEPLAEGEPIEELGRRAGATPGQNSQVHIKCFADAGFFPFLEGLGGRNSILETFQLVTALHRPQVFLPHVTTPFFLLNSLYDSWMIEHILLGQPGRNSSWHRCRKRIKHCSAEQLLVLHGFRRAIVEKVQGLALGGPRGEGRRGFWERNRALLFSCHNHSVSYTRFWHGRDAPRADGRTFAETVGAWFFGEIRGDLFVDCEYPCNKQCADMKQ